MLKRTTYATLLCLISAIFLLVACGGQSTTEPTPTPRASNENQNDGDALQEAPIPQPTYTAVPIDQADDSALEAYPSQPLPAPTALPDDYPAPLPTVDAYPSGLAWIQRPVGLQCEDGTLPGYATLGDARKTLTAAGVRVKEAEIIDIPVAQQCGQPTSVHYRLQISAEDLQTAVSLGWAQSE